MSRLSWGDPMERKYEVGVSKGVLYIDGAGVAWNGLVSVTENPSGGEARKLYVDGIMYLLYSQREEFSATIDALYSPPEFDACDGLGLVHAGMYASQQRRKQFGFCYKTQIGNAVDGEQAGYKIHIVYNALALPTQRTHKSLSNSVEIDPLSWAISARPVTVPGAMPSSHIIIDSTTAPSEGLLNLEDILYGTDFSDPRLPDPDEIASLFEGTTVFTVTSLGSGRYSISGSSFEVAMLDTGVWQITSDNVTILDADHAEITSP